MAVKHALICALFEKIKDISKSSSGGICVFKMFFGTPDTVYGYTCTNKEVPYTLKERMERISKSCSVADVKDTCEFISKALSDVSYVKTAWTNNGTAFRIRINTNEVLLLSQATKTWLDAYEHVLAKYLLAFDPPPLRTPALGVSAEEIAKCLAAPPEYTSTCANSVMPRYPQPIVRTEISTPCKKEKKEVKDFSITNLKDALVNKITSLDKKTVTILAVIALLLLIVGKYQDIKDIAKGIKDKVTRSKNFKAMVEDANNALAGLKKIIGIKESKGDKNEV